jgi:hypothetical protein
MYIYIYIPSAFGNRVAPKAKQKQRVEARRNGTRNVFILPIKENTFTYPPKNGGGAAEL